MSQPPKTGCQKHGTTNLFKNGRCRTCHKRKRDKQYKRARPAYRGSLFERLEQELLANAEKEIF